MLVVTLAFAASVSTMQKRDTLPARDTTDTRDRVGDLNADAVKGGVFPGSFMIPGTNVSLGVGGFVKAVAFYDTFASERSPDFLPGELPPNGDGSGTYAMSAGLSRLFLDGRAPTRHGDARGYIEFDFNGGESVVKLRHAYLRVRTERVELRAGQTWSTFMNAEVKPPLLGEAKASGLTEIRQAQIRFTDHAWKTTHLAVALEDPSSGDVAGDIEATRTPAPDVVTSLAFERGKVTRMQLSGIVRRLKVELADGSAPAATAWGAQLSAVVAPKPRHVVRAGAIVGDGVGRYLQGLDDSGAGLVSPDNDIDTRRAWGANAGYEHPWTEALRSVFVAGTASAHVPAYAPAGTFERSDFLATNLLWRTSRYSTIGVEYAYGQRRHTGVPSVHNHHLLVGFQLF
jgi:hypothetical protein